MAATYKDLVGLTVNTTFIQNTQLAIMKKAQFILNGLPTNSGAFNGLHIWWAYEIVTNRQSLASNQQEVSYVLIQDAAFTSQASGLSSDAMLAAVSDVTFQSAVENALDNTVLKS